MLRTKGISKGGHVQFAHSWKGPLQLVNFKITSHTNELHINPKIGIGSYSFINHSVKFGQEKVGI